MNELKTILNNEAFLGRGWSFPPQITDGGVRMSAYTVIRTNNRNNMVYPFYLNEGTN